MAGRIQAVAQALNSFLIPAYLRGHAGHAGATEAVQHNIARLGVVQDVAHDGFMRHLGVVGMGVIDGVVLAFRDIRGERLSVIFGIVIGDCLIELISRLRLPFLDDLSQEGVGAGSVVGWVGERQDGFVLANREAFDLAGGRVFQEGFQASAIASFSACCSGVVLYEPLSSRIRLGWEGLLLGMGHS